MKRVLMSLSMIMIFGACLGCQRLGNESSSISSGEFKKLSEYYFVATHNAYSYQTNIIPDYYINQYYDFSQQLKDGVRGFLIDTYWYNNAVHLCHAECEGEFLLEDALKVFLGFFKNNTSEILVFVVENHASDEPQERHDRVAEVFDSVGLKKYAYHIGKGGNPLIRDLIDAGTRLILFTEDEESNTPWFGPVYKTVWDTNYRIRELSDFKCELIRGQTDNPIMMLNHFITPVRKDWKSGEPMNGPNREQSIEANSKEILKKHLNLCKRFHKRFPNIVAVDFYQPKDFVFKFVEQLNKCERLNCEGEEQTSFSLF